MDRLLVVSSNIRSIGYDPTRLLLEIEFIGTPEFVYQYSGVPQHAFDSLLAAESKGSYFFAQIKNRFPVRQVPIAVADATPAGARGVNGE